MRLLVVGHRGMLGTDLMEIAGAEHECVGVDINEVDITDLDSTRACLRSVRPEAVINAAAYTDVDGCETREDLAFRVNADGPRHLAIACREAASPLYHVSTDYIFDGQGTRPYLEDDGPNPSGVYGRSKWKGETLLAKETDNFAIIRTAWLYGPGGKNFITTILRLAEENGTLRVVDDQVGSPTHTADLARAILALVELKGRGVFHITNSGFCSWYAFACAILAEAGLMDVTVHPVKTTEFPRPAPRPAYSVLDTSKYTHTTGLELPDWRAALSAFLGRISKGEGTGG